jgi:4-diphosphocytidyl-2-C-methyl-D-erythritol kinase
LPDPVSPFGVLVLVPRLGAPRGEGEAHRGGGEVHHEREAGQAAMLSTADVYAAADRLGLARDSSALRQRRDALRMALELGAALPEERLLHNDLQAASIELCPGIERALAQVTEAGAEVAFVSGSGPTVVGLFSRANGLARAERAAAGLAGLEPSPLTATPVGAGFAAVQRVRT